MDNVCILVVDGDLDHVQKLRNTLAQEGYQVLAAPTGEEALASLRAKASDLVILADTLPDMSSLAACHQIKRDPTISHIPVIMLAPKDDIEIRIRALEVGVDDFLAQPLNWIELRVRVRSMVRVHRLYERVQQANAELAQANRLRQDLMHTIVRDLKSPISTIIGALELVEESLSASLGSYESQLIQTALQASHRQNTLVDNILDVTRLEAGEMPVSLGPVIVRALIEMSVRTCKPTIEQRGIRLTTQIPPDLKPVRADSQLLLRVLTSLLDNAAKFTPEGGEVRVEATYEGELVNLAVVDNGRRIPKEYHEVIFDHRQQAAAKTGGVRTGAGLSLTFCRLAVRAMQGRIWIENPPGMGAAFHIALPTASLYHTPPDGRIRV